MKRGSSCMIRTINLADPWSCGKPAKILQKAARKNIGDPCPRFRGTTFPPYVTVRPVPVRVCTWKDLQRVCPRRPCNWTPPVQPKSLGDKLWGLMSLVVKGTAIAIVIYSMKCNILWKEGDSNELYYQIIGMLVSPDTDQVDANDVKKLKHSMIQLYNQAVFNILGLIAAVPLTLDRELRNLLPGRRPAVNKPKSTSPKPEVDVDRGDR